MPTPSPADPQDPASPVPFSLVVAVWLLVAVLAIALLWAARGFFIPLLLGITLAYVLRPVVDALSAAHVPRSISAFLAVLAVVGTIGTGAYALADDAAKVLEALPRAAREVRVAIQDARSPKPGAITRMQEAARELDKVAAAAAGHGSAQQPAPTPSLAHRAQEYLVAQGMAAVFVMGQALLIFLLTWFLLADVDTFKRKLLKIVGPSFERRKITLQILADIDRQVQRQVGTLFAVNLLIGIATGVAFAMIGLEHALLWGVIAGVLHFIPYVGQAVFTTLSSAAAYLQFGSIGPALGVGAVTLGLSFVIGTVLMTYMQSRAARVNTTVLFVAILFFGWLWGAWGLVLASPILAIVKSVCDHVEAFAPARELLSGQPPEPAKPLPLPAESK